MYLQHADKLSEAGRNFLAAGSRVYHRLVVSDGRAADSGVRSQIEALATTGVLARPVTSLAHADALLAGVWLWHDVLDESHVLSQRIDSPTGSFWHAIMHRREGDFPNAKYWYARCRGHPVLSDISSRLTQVEPDLRGRGDAALERMLAGPSWDPNAFVDFVVRVHRDATSPLAEVAIHLQRIEWAALFDHCIAEAAGA